MKVFLKIKCEKWKKMQDKRFYYAKQCPPKNPLICLYSHVLTYMMLEKHVFWRNICKISDILPSGTVKETRLLMWRQVEEKYDMIPCRYNICMHMRNQTFLVLSFFGFILTKFFLHQYQTNFYFAIFVTALYFHLLDLMIYSPKYILV